MTREADKIIKEIQCKIGYYQEVLKDNPECMKNLVVIIPNDDYEILAERALQYYIANNVRKTKFNSIMGYDLKISYDIDKIYIALDLRYKPNNERIGN